MNDNKIFFIKLELRAKHHIDNINRILPNVPIGYLQRLRKESIARKISYKYVYLYMYYSNSPDTYLPIAVNGADPELPRAYREEKTKPVIIDARTIKSIDGLKATLRILGY
jgi:hypothetical protein